MADTDLRYKTLKDFSRILSVFETQDGEGKRVSDIAKTLQMLPSKASRMLKTLEAESLVERNPRTGRYGIGARFLQIGLLYLANHPLRRVILPHLEEMARDLGLLSAWGIFKNGRTVIVDRIRADNSPPIHLIGSDVPPHTSCYGKLFLAYMGVEERAAILEALSFDHFTPRSIADVPTFEAELRRVQKNGYAIDEEETHPGMVGIAAPIWDESGEIAAALTVSGKADEFSAGKIAEISYLTEKALFVSRQLGYRPHLRSAL